ncbi:205 kDa microtubule-associated protein [Calliphora vicina]|uniref:205 kDa microtubule-associated protein n=1 Tax=Calliphora vicina TaxID=7373 RepID=UPI00325B91DD
MENQEIMDQFLENRQNYMMDNNSMQHMNVNVASAGCDAVVGGVQADVVSGGVGGVAGEILGVKYDEHHEEHDVGDDDELKYVKEVQQSEKQQQQQMQSLKNFGLDDDGTYESNELAEKETTNNAAHEFGNGDGGFVFGGDHHQHQQQQQHHDLFNIGNGHDTNGHDSVNINEDFGNLVSTGFEEKLNMMDSDLDGFKIEGDFSSTSNVTESVEGLIPQVDVKIETKAEHQEMVDEEEPSSLATNTTNGTSSLSENVPAQNVAAPQANAFDDFMVNLENKENSDPLTPQRPNELDLDQAHSQLNPDAKEFIPSFGSNPSSPTSPFAMGMQQNEPGLSDALETQMYFGQAPTAVPRHLMVDDDFVAQSPRKGKGDNNMDAVLLPKESEFELEADKRPHELEPEDVDGFQQRDEVMTPDQAIQQLPLDDLVAQDKENCDPTDSTDFQPSTLNFMDHGPETCVDLDADLDLQPSAFIASLQGEDDVMKRSMYVANDDAIEDVLNSVQPIPTEIDSVNNSFIEESATESAANQLAGDKELLQVEEKEHVSHSPSTEEIQMNLQNTLNSSNKDIPQLPVDMDNANNMQESMYMDQEQDPEQDKVFHEEQQFEQDQMFQQPQVEEQFLQEDLHHEQPQHHLEEQHFQDEFHQEKQTEIEQQLLQEADEKHQEIGNFPEEVQHEMPAAEHQHFQEEVQQFEKLTEESQPQQELLEETPLKEQHHDELLHDQPPQDLMADTQSIEPTEASLLADTTNPLMANDSFLDNSLVSHEQQQDIQEAFSPFKITEELSAAPAIDCFNFDAPENQQDCNMSDVVMTPSSAVDEKHLLEETKEQELFSMSGLEQQMNDMMLNNTDGHLSQAEEVVATTATTAIEDISENLVSPDEAVTLDQYHQHQELEQTQDQMMVDDSFQRHEQECLLQHEQEQQQLQLQLEHEQPKEMEFEQNQQAVADHHESIESPIEQQHQHELESEMVAVEEPIIEAKQAAPLFTHEETEIINVTKTEEIEEKPEEKHELPPSMVPETAPAELLEPPMGMQNETETIKAEVVEEVEAQHQQTIEEVIAEAVKEPVVEEVNAKDEESAKQELLETAEVKTDIPVETVAAVAATAAVVAATAAVGAKIASSPSKTKTEAAKKPLAKTTTTTTAAAKPKVGSTPATKKPMEAAKKPMGLAAKPRTTPARPAATTADKKPIAKTTTTTTTTAARKPLSATSTTASKVLSKTSTTTSTTRTATAASKTTTTTRPTTAPRTLTSTTTARKPATTSSTTNGPLAKPRPATAPAKPTTLGLSATNGAPKPKPTSPRSTLASQVRKTTPATTAAKSPVKSTATNGVAKTAATTLASRTKTTTSTVSSTAGKTFTARPAPKFTSSSSSTTTTTTTRRLTVGGTTAASTTTTTTKTSSTPMRKSSPTKPATGRTPSKSSNTAGGLKSKTPAAKPASPPAKPAPIRKPVDKTALINGDAAAQINKELNGTAEKITAPAEEQQQQASPQNGDLQAVQHEQHQNGDSSIPMQTEGQQQSLLEPRDEQIPMDLINA